MSKESFDKKKKRKAWERKKEKLGKRSILTEEGLSKKAKLSEKYYSVFPDTTASTIGHTFLL